MKNPNVDYLKNVKSEHSHEAKCQLALFLSAKTPEQIRDILAGLIEEINQYDRPAQGITILTCIGIKEVIRPSWVTRD